MFLPKLSSLLCLFCQTFLLIWSKYLETLYQSQILLVYHERPTTLVLLSHLGSGNNKADLVCCISFACLFYIAVTKISEKKEGRFILVYTFRLKLMVLGSVDSGSVVS